MKFLRKWKPSKVAAFWLSNKHDIPSTPGIYILIAKHGITFRYPNGKSPVYYIGETANLKKRLAGHRRQHNHKSGWIYEARHEYGKVFGGRCCYVQTWQGMTRKKLEWLVIREFMKCYYAPPVTNGAQKWDWVKK